MTYSMHVWMNRFEPFLTFKGHGTSRLLSPSFLSLSFSYEHPIFCCYLVICPHDLPLKIWLALNIRLFLLKVRLFPIFHYPVQFPYSWRIHWPWPPRHVKYQTTAVEHCVAILHHQLPLDQHHLRLPRHHHLAQQHEKHIPDGTKHTHKGVSETRVPIPGTLKLDNTTINYTVSLWHASQHKPYNWKDSTVQERIWKTITPTTSGRPI